ncbi:peptidase C14 [Seonamhaeicola sp. S2-3]|uniref:caspase family protein n=1 Tax=Seonamhaeicola sp. S2-3 TaxID=1936081 RepID=UPI000972891B|nr:caspase family protein [Seonamhaeicola sp. S2-3]APY11151.1 peptidase C14 [Seonamhaeicola sp. S2-3]
MKKIILALLVCFSFQFLHAEKYALIIAVGNYPKKTGWSTISSVNDVPLIKQTLLNQKFEEANITLLIDEQATYAGIKEALNNLLSKVKPDDIVVIHYSGHGQQIFDDNDEEIDGKDEALVPYDAWVRYNNNYKGEHHFRDDELGNFITKFRNKLGKQGQLLLLLDSCHSGSSTRGGKARGSEAVFAPSNWKPNKSGDASGSDMTEKSKEKLQDNAAPFVLISGASANELNYEYKGTGSLSYAFSKAMNSLGSNFSYNQLFAKIESQMNVISPKQNPTIEGDLNVKLFNNSYVKQQPYYKVKSVPRADIIKIQAGKIQGLFKNTTVNILPSASTKVEEDKIITKGIITVSKFNESIIKLDTPLEDFNEKNYWVFIDEPSYGDIAVNVFFDASLKDNTITNGISEFLLEKNLGEVVKKIDSADVVLAAEGNNITLKATNGLIDIDKDEETRGSTTVDAINQKLFAFAQGQYLKNLDFKNYNYEFEFKLLPIEYDVLTDAVGDVLDPSILTNENGTFQVKPEVDNVVLQVTNKSERPLYFSIIEINSKGEIFPFMPNDNCSLNDDERKLAPGQTMIFKDCIFSFGPPYEKLILKGFATSTPINFQPTVETRGDNSRNAANPLETFLANSFTQSRGSTGKKSSARINGYSTEFVYEIVKE